MSLVGKEWIEVFASPNPALISAVRSALTGENIEFSVHGDLTLAHRGCVTPARVLVLRAEAERAAAVLRRVTAAIGS